MPMIADELLQGAIDLHVHGYPEISNDVKTRLDDSEIVKAAIESGMRAIVLKSHMWPTVGRAYHLQKQFPGFYVIPSITLNTTVGGLNPVSVESAAKQGAKVIFMPTWSASNDIRQGGFSTYMKTYLDSLKNLMPEHGLQLLDQEGHLKDEVNEILQIARRYKLAIATGHISINESVALIEEANRLEVWPIIYTHPDSRSVGSTRTQIQMMSEKGAFVEICALGMMPAFQRIHPREVIEIIKNIGAEKCVLSTDFFFDWAPPVPEMLRMTMGTLLSLGLSPEEIRLLVQINPAKILRL
jgi:hypothetical protein